METKKELNFIESYLDFYTGTEPPTIFNRWCAISSIATVLGRKAWVQHGHSKIYPNQYIMLVGESGSRKSTAIKTFNKPLLEEMGFKKVASNKTSKEKFLMDLMEGMENVNNPEDHLDVRKDSGFAGGRANPTMRELFGVVNAAESSECLVMSDDFNNFIGHSNIEFIELLTDLWDYNGIYSSRTKSGRSVLVPNPTLNLQIGNTQQGISLAFPTETIGQGFFSRLIMVHSDPSGRKITFPAPPDLLARKKLIETLIRIQGTFRGEIKIEPTAMIALDDIYTNWKDLQDVRFKSYSTRRFTHLLKLCLCCAASSERAIIDRRIVEYANTILHYTEFFMPKALGEFGKARHSDVSAKILELLEKSDRPLDPIADIYQEVHRDLDGAQELVRILKSLQQAGKIQQTSRGLLPAKAVLKLDFPHCRAGLLREYVESRAKEGLPL